MAQQVPTPAPKNKKRLPLIILGAIAALGLIISLAVSFGGPNSFLVGLFNTLGTSGGYGAKVAAYDAVNKKFSSGETMHYGPYDVTATSVLKTYHATSSELVDMKDRSVSTERRGPEYYSSLKGGFRSPDANLVQVKVKVQYQPSRVTTDGPIFTELDPYTESLQNMKLNGEYAVLYRVEGKVQEFYKQDEATLELLKSGKPLELEYLFKEDTAATGVLSLVTYVYTRVSSIFGTEGMPTREYEYTLPLW